MEIGAKLSAARKNAGFTQEALSEKLGVTPQAISTWERNENVPDTRNLIDLARILEISLDDLFSGSDAPSWELRSPTFSPEHMYTYVKARAQAEKLNQTLAALPLMREKHQRTVPGRHRPGAVRGPSADTRLSCPGNGACG